MLGYRKKISFIFAGGRDQKLSYALTYFKKTLSAEDIPLIEDVFLLQDVMLQKVSRVLLKWLLEHGRHLTLKACSGFWFSKP